MPATQVKKLSVATVYGKIDVKKLVNAPGERLELFTVLGLAVGQKTGISSYGDWTALLGQFEATNLETGETFSGPSLFLPSVALTSLQVAMMAEGSRGVEFAIKVCAVLSKSNKPGAAAYEYTWEPLIPPDANDPVTRLKARLLALSDQSGETEGKPAAETSAAPAAKAGRGAK